MNQNMQQRDRARKLLDAGKIGEALSLLEQNIKNAPKDIDSLYLSGICYAKTGNYAAAEKFFSRTVKLNKDLFQAYTDLGLSQSFQRKVGDAIRSFKKSLAINATFAPAHFNIALAYLQTQESRKALHHAKKSVEIDGENPAYLNVLALCYRASGQIEKAIDTFKTINATHPKFYGAYQNLYETYRLIHDIPRAENVLLDAKSLFSGQVNVYTTLGKLYEQCNRAEEARNLYAEGIERCKDSLELRVLLGRVNRIVGHYDEGLVQIDRALGIDSAFQPALAERCSFHILKGEYDDAYTLLNNFISSAAGQPVTAGLSMAYAQVCRLTDRLEESVSTSRKTLETPGLPDEMQSVILFSMGDSYDQMQKYDRAFTTYRKANNAVSHPSDLDRYLGIFSDIASGVGRDFPVNAIPPGSGTRKPVFIVGMPRSGTSLAEQIIASHPDAYGAGELTEFWGISQDVCQSKHYEQYTEKRAMLSAEELSQYAERYLAFVEKLAPDAARITDKLPHNFMHIGLIKQLFPDAHIIHCHRHPFDTCLSIYFKKFNENHIYARNLAEIARFYLQYQELMQLWDKTVTGIFSLKYEDLVTNPEKVTRDIISHIELEWHDNCLRHHESNRLVTTPSYTQVNRPIYTDSLNRWKHYERHLQPLVDVLGNPEQFE